MFAILWCIDRDQLNTPRTRYRHQHAYSIMPCSNTETSLNPLNDEHHSVDRVYTIKSILQFKKKEMHGVDLNWGSQINKL